MLSEITKDAEVRMAKSIDALVENFKKIRTGRAHPSILDSVQVSYYGSMMPISQVANITVEDSRTLTIIPWEKKMVPEVEKAIMKSDLGINPNTSGDVIRVPMPALTQETRKGFIRQAKAEAESAKVAIRNIRRDANGSIKDLLKEKSISEDEERRGEDQVQKLTDKFVSEVDALLAQKESDLMEI
ncbi:MAG: ribosome recycling factor [Nitrincola lacisaponensis]|uniref:Ribosome-recycling factor n=1 Tax=Nitrincola lacisaponensis TaxID=267850 RepID=A0A063Y7Y2_9GAMM|nr:ribosome recycling factor [Nitrincola lacisaponensis]KDE40482.1 Ribosome recycling factor [Nitrincola lacisaponensis]